MQREECYVAHRELQVRSDIIRGLALLALCL
jgi:hypothetical protein